MTNRGDQFELNNRNEIISKRASVGYVNRNLTNDGRLRYYYDCENRLTDVNDHEDMPVASYKYDFAGSRVKKIDYTLSPVRHTLYSVTTGEIKKGLVR